MFLKNAVAFETKHHRVLKRNIKLLGEGGEGLEEGLNGIDIDKKRSHPLRIASFFYLTND